MNEVQNQGLNPSPGTVATTMNTQTTVSTVVQGPLNPRALDTGSDDGQSQNSYATSAGDDASSKLRVPAPPEAGRDFDSEPIECPYCFCLVEMNSSHSWMKVLQ